MTLSSISAQFLFGNRLFLSNGKTFTMFSKMRFSSLDTRETEKFARAAPDWWNHRGRGGASMLHALNPVRMKYIMENVGPCIQSMQQREVSRRLDGLRAIDIGCGGGILSESLARSGAHVVGIDPTPEAIAAATEHAMVDPVTSRIDYRNTTVEEVTAGGAESFDLVCALEVIEHVRDPKAFIRECAQLVAPGGALVISTLNRNPKSWVLAIALAEYAAGLLPPGTHDWGRFQTPDETQSAMEAVGLELIHKAGIIFDPSRLQPFSSPRAWRLSETDLDVNYIMYAVKKTGR